MDESTDRGVGTDATADLTQPDPAPEQTNTTAAGRTGEQAQQVAGTAREQAGEVMHEAREQAGNVIGEARHQLRTQADEQTQRLGGALHDLGRQFQALADGRAEEAGAASDYADRLAGQVLEIAGRVDEMGFDGLVGELQRFARRRPGAFLAGAAIVGFASARMGRGAKEAEAQRSQYAEDGPTVQSGRQRAHYPEDRPTVGSGRPADIDLTDPTPTGDEVSSRAHEWNREREGNR